MNKNYIDRKYIIIAVLRAMVDMVECSGSIKSEKQKIRKIISQWKFICVIHERTLLDRALKKAVSYDLLKVPYEYAINYINVTLNMYEEAKRYE